MLKTLKFKGDDNDFKFVSDLHQHHNRDFIFKPRGYNSVEEHDSGNINNWNKECNENSTVFHLGDVIFNDGRGDRFYELLRRLNFKELYLLWGNHSSGQRQSYLSYLKNYGGIDDKGQILYEVYPLSFDLDGNSNKKVIFLPQYAEICINHTNIVLCHYPLISHNDQGHGSLHLTGHTHSNCNLTNKNLGKGFRLDVGIESFGGPVSLTFIKRFLGGRGIDSVDHHNNKTT